MQKTNEVIGFNKKLFEFLDVLMLQTLYTSLIHCSYLDYQYACVVWCPFQLGGMRAIEKIQRCATKIVPSLKDKSYYDRLISLNLPGCRGGHCIKYNLFFKDIKFQGLSKITLNIHPGNCNII